MSLCTDENIKSVHKRRSGGNEVVIFACIDQFMPIAEHIMLLAEL
jgi:hypothetical protein